MKPWHSAILIVPVVLCACGSDGDSATTNSTGETGSTGTASQGSTGTATVDVPTTGTPPTTVTTGEVTASETASASASASAGETTTGMVDSTSDDSDSATDASTGPDDTDTGDDTTTDGDAPVYDPDKDGPWTTATRKGTWKVGQVDVAMDAIYPVDGPEAGPYPVVVVAHGFQLPPTQYTKYVQRLATHGYVALTADFQASLFNTNHVANTQQVLGGIDWVAQDEVLGPISDTNNVGLTGHSLGGKLSVQGAASDNRVRASITLDPVDGSQNCSPQNCPDVTDMLPLDIPLGYVGETLDTMGFMACAPADDNFLTFYQPSTAPALAVTVLGANHMSFLDNAAGCGFVCNFCQPATLDNAVVNNLARAYVVAFYGRYLRDNPGYDTYLTGDEAEARYVTMGLVTLQSK